MQENFHFADGESNRKSTQGDNESRPVYSKFDLTETRTLIKSSSLDVDLMQFDDE